MIFITLDNYTQQWWGGSFFSSPSSYLLSQTQPPHPFFDPEPEPEEDEEINPYEITSLS